MKNNFFIFLVYLCSWFSITYFYLTICYLRYEMTWLDILAITFMYIAYSTKAIQQLIDIATKIQ